MNTERQRQIEIKKIARGVLSATLISLMTLFGSKSFAQQNRSVPTELGGSGKTIVNTKKPSEKTYVISNVPKELGGSSPSKEKTENKVIENKEFIKQREWLKNRYSNPSIQKRLAKGNEYIIKKIVGGKEKILKNGLEYMYEEMSYGVENSSGFFNSLDSTIRVVKNDSLIYIHEKIHQCVELSPAQESWILQFAEEEYLFVTEERIFNNMMIATKFHVQEMVTFMTSVRGIKLEQRDSVAIEKMRDEILPKLEEDTREAAENLALPQEIYARIMEFRYMYNIKPGEKVMPSKIKEINQGIVKKLKEGDIELMSLDNVGCVLLCLIYGTVEETSEGIAISIDLERFCTLLNTLP